MPKGQRLRVARFALVLLSLGIFGVVEPIPAAAAAAQTSAKSTVRKKAPRSRVAPKRRYSATRSRARRATLAKARAAARARAAREVAEPRYKLDDAGMLVPDIRAEAAIIYNPKTGEVLWEENSLTQRSLASITKAMTALVFLQDDPDFDREVVVERADVYAASTTYLRVNDSVRVGDLVHLLLIASDNAAARVLARISPTGADGFMQRMNETAKDLGLASTRFLDPSGLNAGNVSSAYDISRLIVRATADERIAAIMRKSTYSFATHKRTINIHTTNKLIDLGMDVQGGKTGFISKAGYCLATLLKLPQGDQVAVVVLGARSNAGRFMETKHLFNWLSGKTQNLFGSTTTAQAQPE